MSVMKKIKIYYRLAKPGIVYGNTLTTIAAFLFASAWQGSVFLFLATVVGIIGTIASAAVCNNYIDREMDGKMERTKHRPLVTGAVSLRGALIYASILGVIGIGTLAVFVNLLSAGLGLFGFLMYVFVYGYYKRNSEWGAVVGTIPGGIPAMVGYTAFTNSFDISAVLIFFTLVLWQLPHFYGIALFRMEEYVAAGVPILPARRGVELTKQHIIFFIISYLLVAPLLFFVSPAGYVYLVTVLLFGISWLTLAVRGYSSPDYASWARRVFFFSLAVMISLSFALTFASILP